MAVKFDFIAIITAIGLFILLLFAIIMLKNKKGNFRANIVFSVFLLCTSFVIADAGIILYSRLYCYLPHFARIPTLSQLLYGPLFLTYLKVLMRNERIFTRYSLPHLVPFIVLAVIFIPFFAQDSDHKLTYVYNRLYNTLSGPDAIKESLLTMLILTHISLYLLYSLWFIHKFETDIKRIYSNEKVHLSWIKLLTILFLSIILVMFVLYLFIISSNVQFGTVYRFIPILSTISLCFLTYKAMSQSSISIGVDLARLQKDIDASVLQQNEIEEIVKKIDHIMNNKAFLEMGLSLPDLAQKVGTTRGKLSLILNNYYKTNFYNFVNKFRIEEAKRIIMQSNGANILNIGLSVGFNSKTSFNVYFRKYMKMSPSQYKKRHNG